VRPITEQTISLDLPSALESVRVLHALISELLRLMGLDEQTAIDVNLAVVEAGTNAIKHGNQEEAHKRAHFDFIIRPDQFIVVVQDEGPGFNREQVPSPLAGDNFFKSSGRGIFLMESCMDEVTFEQSGTVIKMVKYLKPETVGS